MFCIYRFMTCMPFETVDKKKAFYTYRSIVKSTWDLPSSTASTTTWNEYRLGHYELFSHSQNHEKYAHFWVQNGCNKSHNTHSLTVHLIFIARFFDSTKSPRPCLITNTKNGYKPRYYEFLNRQWICRYSPLANHFRWWTCFFLFSLKKWSTSNKYWFI